MTKATTTEGRPWITDRWTRIESGGADHIEIMVAGGIAFMRHSARPDQLIHMTPNELDDLDMALFTEIFKVEDA